ncbi:hypothetical protein LEM8419_00128 [Neolewinella maritima]|uniref:Uncharacterized protein n=1 Tax=Neolewinella maritima TaxID=1383882 RepID=A0ABN8F296_9BACT|nr:YbjN domain-containing protein [Neolewinella maritima]CAH0998796.1 hypothetical protein LEM8419_00128 [Neolewinella maritima]
MSIWDSLFNRSRTPAPPEPQHRFGRYTDAYKSKAKHAAYTRAADAFEEHDFLDSVEAFLEYLSDEAEENVKWQRRGETVYFELYQGSKRVTGLADTAHLRASARIARLTTLNGELLQRLTAMNYALKYSRFALDDDDCLTIIFDTPVHDASPYKLYYALKEMALRADKQDDLLLHEFEHALSPVEVTHLAPIPAPEKAVKLDFLRQHIQSLLDYLDSGQLDPQEHPGAVAYLLLDLVYRLDYLLTPEGYTMEALERMHRMYFAREDAQSVNHKNERLLDELQQLLERAPEDFGEELYAGKSTFGITLPVSHDRLATLINNELPNLDWYQDNGYPEVACAIPGYIVGYALFNYAIPLPDRALLHLYYRVTEEAYFLQLGFTERYLDKAGRPNKRSIRSAVNRIVKQHEEAFPWFSPDTSELSYANLLEFSQTYLEMVKTSG